MTGEILTAGDIGRLKAAASVTGTTDRVPIYQAGVLKYATPDQLASDLTAVVADSVTAGTVTATTSVTTPIEIVTNITTASSSQTLSNDGIAKLAGSSVMTLFLQPPTAGCFKWIRSLSTIAHTVTSSAAFIGTTAATTITFSAPTGLIMRGESSIQWGIYGEDSTGYATT
jgi:hypothetical protein